ncbi:MAG: radical SAM protein [Clostridiales bacterium]|nr:radical SAM protein [Clostridiales bacterium]
MRYEGNIYRPPGEWRSYLLQVTVGCSHNKCTFCSMYKDKQFHIRPMADIFEDIEMARAYYSRLGRPVKRVFLCDGDAVIMRTEQLLAILKKLYDSFPELERVTAYAGPRSALTKTPEELRSLREAGLYRVYLGVETGSDELLHTIKKGVDAQEMLEAGIRLREAGLDLWVMVLLGLAGPGEPSRRHILATAEMMNRMKPRHLSALTYMPEPDTEMGEQVERGEFQLITGPQALEETRLLLEHLDVDPLHFTCDHASNYLPLKGGLPEDRQAMLSAIDLALEDQELLRSEYGRGL